MKRLLNRNYIEVTNVTELPTTYGGPYRLYKNDITYYAQEDDSDISVVKLGEYDTDLEAIEAFKSYIDDLENDNY